MSMVLGTGNQPEPDQAGKVDMRAGTMVGMMVGMKVGKLARADRVHIQADMRVGKWTGRGSGKQVGKRVDMMVGRPVEILVVGLGYRLPIRTVFVAGRPNVLVCFVDTRTGAGKRIAADRPVGSPAEHGKPTEPLARTELERLDPWTIQRVVGFLLNPKTRKL